MWQKEDLEQVSWQERDESQERSALDPDERSEPGNAEEVDDDGTLPLGTRHGQIGKDHGDHDPVPLLSF